MDTTPSTLSLSWGSIPPRGFQKRAARLVFAIPGGLYGTLLPLPDLSLKGLTDFPFPPQSTIHSKVGLALYFSKDVPMDISPIILLKLQRLLMPEPTIIRQLVEFSRQAWLDGFHRAAHRPFYGYGRHITAVEISSKISTVRPGTITAVNGYYGRFRVMTPMSCE
jgi:hypothetical protein